MNILKKSKRIVQGLILTFKSKKYIPIVKTVDHELLMGKVALITGGSGGIGFAIAKKFIDCGCKVIIAGTNEEKLRNKCDELGKFSFPIVLKVQNIHEFSDKVESASKFFGSIDIFVCSHGIHTKRQGFDFLNVTEEEYDDVMNINLKGTYFLCQSIARYMIRNKVKGHILIISSQSALEPSWSPYRLSKRGIAAITEGIAQELLQKGIIVNALGPGPTATTMQDKLIHGSIYTADNPIGRYTMPEEIAEYAKMLVSDLGATIVGQTIYMSGGRGIIDKR
jgi:NAD(P)-dependent dehydrogenase (short-subunit alcohol dehydrogenase family)